MKSRKAKPPHLISSELYNDEEIIWWGQPIASRLALQVSIIQVLMNVAVAVFSVWFFIESHEMMSNSITERSSDIRSAVSLILTIVPCVMFAMTGWMAIAPLRQYIVGRKTYYLLTDRRAVIIENMLSKHVQSFYDENINRIEVRYFGRDIGSIIFATQQMTRRVSQGKRVV